MKPGADTELDEKRHSWFEKVVSSSLIFITCGILVVIMFGVGAIPRKPVEEAPAPISSSEPPTLMESAAREVLEAFFEAPDVAAKSEFVGMSARVRPLMEDFHEKRGHAFPTLGSVSTGKRADFNGQPMVLFEVEPYVGPRYHVAVIWDGNHFTVDWESLTAYGTMDWMEFAENKPMTAQTMRVYVRQAERSDTPPGAERGAVFFQIEHRDHPQPIIAAADGETASTLLAMTENRRVPVTLALAWETRDTYLAPMPWIRSLVSQGWSP
ncbi:MAG: hypothetical protein RLZZ505_2335 [Verrucomicrobiota bacterium]|jgi:hypothetical protein